jgi:Cys-rich four helix bundle protein (predicted Tat secretion target)
MDRREMLAATATLAAAVVATQASAQEEHHHHHTGHPYQGVIEAAAHCLMAGQACEEHCIELLGKGEKEMAACLGTVAEALAVCEALQRLASQKSKYLGRSAALALDVCKNCEDECRKHEKKHETCKACADACAACATECKRLAA